MLPLVENIRRKCGEVVYNVTGCCAGGIAGCVTHFDGLNFIKQDKVDLICIRPHFHTCYLLSFVLIQKKVTKKKSRKKRYTARFFLSP